MAGLLRYTGIPSFMNGLKEESGTQAGWFSQIPVPYTPA